MVKIIKGWVTEYGSMHSTYEEARKTELEEKREAFNRELRDTLGYSEIAWRDRNGASISNMVIMYAPVFRRMLDKYELGLEHQ